MQMCAEVVEMVLACGLHSVIFCSSYLFHRFYQLLAVVMGKHEEPYAVDSDTNKIFDKPFLAISSK